MPDLLWEVIWHLLAKVPAARPGPADRVANQLTALAHDLAGAPPAPPLTAPPPPTPPPPVHRVATELAGGQVLSAPPAAGGPGLGGPAAGHPPPPYAPGSPPPPYVPGGPPPSYAPGPPLAPAGRVYRVSGKALGIGTGIVLALALAIVLTVVIVREAGGQSPSDVADAYLSAWNRGDFGRIEDLSCREDRREMLDLDPIEREDSRFGEPPGRYEIVGESVRGERAEVFIELADFEESGNLPLVREDGRWRVCWNRL